MASLRTGTGYGLCKVGTRLQCSSVRASRGCHRRRRPLGEQVSLRDAQRRRALRVHDKQIRDVAVAASAQWHGGCVALTASLDSTLRITRSARAWRAALSRPAPHCRLVWSA